MTATVLALHGVRVTYGDLVALDRVDLLVRAGERVALVGPSGAGKTSLLALPTAAVRPAAGEVEVLGRSISTSDARTLRDLRSRIGTIHQRLDLVGPLKVVHNVNAGRLGTWSRRRALRSLIRPVDVDAARRVLDSVGIADKLYERTDRLSGGEQQRVALARVLVQEPALVLADEPVSSLDPARADDVMRLITERTTAQGCALVVSLHDFELARRRCDRIVGIRAGRIAFDRPARDVTDTMAHALYQLSP